MKKHLLIILSVSGVLVFAQGCKRETPDDTLASPNEPAHTATESGIEMVALPPGKKQREGRMPLSGREHDIDNMY